MYFGSQTNPLLRVEMSEADKGWGPAPNLGSRGLKTMQFRPRHSRLYWFAPVLILVPVIWRFLLEPPPPPNLEDLNVVLIVVDTLRSDALGFMNPEVRTTPHLDRLAEQGVVFERAYAPAPWTQPSMASLFTGLMPSTHNVRLLMDHLGEDRLTLAEALRARGFSTHGIVTNNLISESLGFAQGFDDYELIAKSGRSIYEGVTSRVVTNHALEWLAKRKPGPYFLLVHYFDPHYSYQHHPGYSLTDDYGGKLHPGMPIDELRRMSPDLDAEDIAYLRKLYQEEVAFTDYQIGRLLKALDQRGGDRKLIIFTADHGEEFLSHGWLGHTRTLYEELIHVPLVVRLTGALQPRRIQQPVSLVDLFPTLLDLSRVPDKELQSDGLSLRNLLFFGTPLHREQVRAEVSFLPPNPKSEAKRALLTAVIEPDRKLIHNLEDDSWQAFDLLRDANEKANLFAKSTSWEELRADLTDWEAIHVPSWGPELDLRPRIDAETERRLRSLGYVQ